MAECEGAPTQFGWRCGRIAMPIGLAAVLHFAKILREKHALDSITVTERSGISVPRALNTARIPTVDREFHPVICSSLALRMHVTLTHRPDSMPIQPTSPFWL